MNEEITVLDLFSGIGGFSYAAHLANRGSIGPVFRTSAFVERDQFCQRVLKKHWPEVPIFDDVTTLDADRLGRIDMVTAGFPCQPASVAGARKGREDDRWLWPEIIRIVRATRPTWLLLENVRGLLTLEGGMVFEDCIVDLEAAGYESQTFIIPACAIDSAPHRRDRLWIVGYTKYDGQSSSEERGRLLDKSEEQKGQKAVGQSKRTGCASDNVADTNGSGCRGGNSSKRGLRKRKIQSEEQGRREVGRETEGRSKSCGEDVADTNGEGLQRHDNADRSGNRQSGRWQVANEGLSGRKESSFNVADSDSKRGCGWDTRWQDAKDVGQSSRSQGADSGRLGEGKSKPSICRMDDGVSRRLDEAGRHPGWENGEPEGMERVSVGVKDRALRLRSLGNSIVPQVAEQIFRAILESERQNER